MLYKKNMTNRSLSISQLTKTLHLKMASVVWHHSLLLMNSFNKTEAAVFSCRLCFLRAFPFISLTKQQFKFSNPKTKHHITSLFQRSIRLWNDEPTTINSALTVLAFASVRNMFNTF